MFEDYAGRRFTVMGLGRFGGGLGVTRWLAGQGAEVLVTDTEPAERLAASVAALEDLVARGPVRLRLGGHDVEDFTGADAVVASPAVARPWENAFLEAARGSGVPITTEIRLLVERLDRHRVIGVTGTAGKSTTVAMIGHVLRGVFGDERVHVGGNIGGSLLGALPAIGRDDWVVLELSSFMLHWLHAGAGSDDAPGFSPHAAVLTNLSDNHTDWHGTFEHYAASKQVIFRYQDDGDFRHRGEAMPIGPELALGLPGAHNQRNARLAIDVVGGAPGVDPAEAARHLESFASLPHRLELVEVKDGRRFYNDSKSTTPAASVLAVASFDAPERVHLIAGGYDKGSDLSEIAAVAPRLAGLYTIGQTGPALASASGGAAVHCATLDAAVARAMERMGEADVLLLSPGCASWDQFENFEVRGEAFRRAVAQSHQE